MDNNSDTLSITLKLGGRTLQMTVKREDEILYRDAAKLINQRFNYYASSFPNQNNEMYLTMTLLDVAVKLKGTERSADSTPVYGRLETLLEEVEKAIGDSK